MKFLLHWTRCFTVLFEVFLLKSNPLNLLPWYNIQWHNIMICSLTSEKESHHPCNGCLLMQRKLRETFGLAHNSLVRSWMVFWMQKNQRKDMDRRNLIWSYNCFSMHVHHFQILILFRILKLLNQNFVLLRMQMYMLINHTSNMNLHIQLNLLLVMSKGMILFMNIIMKIIL